MKEKREIRKEKKGQETEELKAHLLRLQADFDNYRKRTQKEKEDFGKFACTDLTLRILPTLDHFKLALKHLPKELTENEWVKGIWHIERQLEQTLADEGLTEIETTGQKFNHERHEAVEEVKSEKPTGTIIDEVQKGYMLGDKVIRPARVRVAK